MTESDRKAGEVERLRQAYIQALPLWAVYVVGAGRAGNCSVGWCRDTRPHLRQLAAVGSIEPDTAHVLFTYSDADAMLIVAAVEERLAASGIEKVASCATGTIAGTFSVLIEAARALSIRVATADEIAEQARVAVERFTAEFDVLQRSSGLRQVNAAYRRDRIERSARGETSPNYSTWLAQYKARLVALLAAERVARADMVLMTAPGHQPGHVSGQPPALDKPTRFGVSRARV